MHLQYLKKVPNETEELKGLRSAKQKDRKSALFCNSVNSIISSSKFSFEEKNYLKLIISFNFSNKTFMQKSKDQRPFNFFQFWYPKNLCFCPLPPLNNVEKQLEKLSYGFSALYMAIEGVLKTLFKIPIIFYDWLSEIYKKKRKIWLHPYCFK